MTTQHIAPEWAFEFHGHQCPFMPIGYRMGRLALEKLGVEREKDHGFFVFPELGEAHPQTCLMDGIQAATGATYGKLLIAKTFYGKLAATFYHPQKGGDPFFAQAGCRRRDGQVRVHRLSARKGSSRPRFRRRSAKKSSAGSMNKPTTRSLPWSQSPTSSSSPPRARSTRPSAAPAANTCSIVT